MVIESGVEGRRIIRLVRLEFDHEEGLDSATFHMSLGAHTLVSAVLPEYPTSMASGDGVLTRLELPEIRTLVEYFADPGTPKTPEADAIFNRVIVILGTFREDLL